MNAQNIDILNDIGSHRIGPIIRMHLPSKTTWIDDLQKWASGIDQSQLLGNGSLLCSSLLHQIHKDAFSVCTPVSFMIFFLSLQVMQSLPSLLHTDCVRKPRYSNSTCKLTLSILVPCWNSYRWNKNYQIILMQFTCKIKFLYIILVFDNS